MLAVYHDGKQIALHRLAQAPKSMVVNRNHYGRILARQRTDVENTLLHHPVIVDVPVQSADLTAYDAAIGGDDAWRN